MSYLRPLENEEIDDAEILRRFRHYAETRGFTPNSIRTMARRPAIVKAFMGLNQAVLYEGSVSSQLKMLVSLASSVAAGCRYCQSHMANLSSIYEVPDDKIAAVWEFESSPLFDASEKAAIAVAIKAGSVPNEVSAADFDRLAAHFDEGQIVEIIASIALFGFLNRWNDTMATTVEPLPSEVARRAAGSAGWEPGKHAGP